MSTIHRQQPRGPSSPESLPGFEQLQRFWEPDTQRWTVKILPGEYYVTRNDEAITTVLGSCVSACIRDPLAQVGGMNHFMLPEDNSVREAGGRALDRQATRYGSYAMESLINDLLKLGAARERLEIKLFGGGRMLASMTDIGARNIAFITQLSGHRRPAASRRRISAATSRARSSTSRRRGCARMKTCARSRTAASPIASSCTSHACAASRTAATSRCSHEHAGAAHPRAGRRRLGARAQHSLRRAQRAIRRSKSSARRAMRTSRARRSRS